MKVSRLLWLLCFASAGLATAAQRQFAFERDNAIWVANLDGTNERKIANGIFPAISPDMPITRSGRRMENGSPSLCARMSGSLLRSRPMEAIFAL